MGKDPAVLEGKATLGLTGDHDCDHDLYHWGQIRMIMAFLFTVTQSVSIKGREVWEDQTRTTGLTISISEEDQRAFAWRGAGGSSLSCWGSVMVTVTKFAWIFLFKTYCTVL